MTTPRDSADDQKENVPNPGISRNRNLVSPLRLTLASTRLDRS
jgi:hypothetical protein